ncbi:MAG: cation transporter [Clostridia bacterium]|nr:cation transporter [Clostridia bacterium]
MVWLLSKLFIKNPKEYKNPKTRESYGVLSGFLGIFLNIALFAFKLVAGIISGAVSIMADAFNNLMDAGSSIVTLIGVKKASKHADEDHPFGHGRIEYIAGMLVAVLILFVAYELISSSVNKIFNPQEIKLSTLAIVILSVSVAVKLYMFLYNFLLAKKINSLVLKATAFDSISDSVSTLVVLVAFIVSPYLPFAIDGYIGSLVALFIFYTGFKSLKETANALLGQKPDKDFVENVQKFVLEYDKKVLGIHDLIVHNYGEGKTIISLHCEVSNKENVDLLHDMIDAIEFGLNDKFNCLATIHMDPIVTDCDQTNICKKQVIEKIHEINPQYSIHDFRMTGGESHINLIFDVVIPLSDKTSHSELEKTILQKVREINPLYNIVIKIEHSYV